MNHMWRSTSWVKSGFIPHSFAHHPEIGAGAGREKAKVALLACRRQRLNCGWLMGVYDYRISGDCAGNPPGLDGISAGFKFRSPDPYAVADGMERSRPGF